MKLNAEDLEIINLIGINESFEFKKVQQINFFHLILIECLVIGFGSLLFLNSNNPAGKILIFILFFYIFFLIIHFFKLNKKENIKNPILEKKHNKIIKFLFKDIKKEKEALIALKMLNNDLNNLRLIKIQKNDLKKEKTLTLKKYRKLLKNKIAYNKKLMKY